MIQLSSFMWTLAIFFGIVGFLRGWNRELVATAGLLLALFAVFQFDGILRGTIFLGMPRSQIFMVETIFYIGVAFVVYQANDIGGSLRRDEGDWQSGILGGLVGFVNGYLMGGSIWYFLDINEYPLSPLVIAPSSASPSAEALNTIPLVLLGGGASGTGDLLAVVVIALLFVVIIIA